jgi:tetratricopeptide (TPR) repeat protein
MLGIVSDITGDLPQWKRRLIRAAELYRELDDRRGLASALTNLAGVSTIGEFEIFATPLELVGLSGDDEMNEALRIVREIHWRSGEAYALLVNSLRSFASGDTGAAIRFSNDAEAIASSIQHREWLAGVLSARGLYYRNILEHSLAVSSMEWASIEAKKSRSLHWQNLATGVLASTYAMSGDIGRSERLLGDVGADFPMNTMGQRLVWLGRLDLGLAKHEFDQALEIADRLIATAKQASSLRDLPYLLQRRCLALSGAGRHDDAIAEWPEALESAMERQMTARLWRFHAGFAETLRAAGQVVEAEQQRRAAWLSAQSLSDSIDDPDLRQSFLDRVHNLLFPSS